jgi:hypothetical protein
VSERTRYSTLKHFATSALAYKNAAKLDGAHIRKGSAVHAIVFRTQPVTVYDAIRRGKEWQAFQDQHVGHIILSRKEYEQAEAMAKAVLTNPLVKSLGLLTAPDLVIEKEILWDYDEVPFSSTPDVHCPDFGWDLKTTQCAMPRMFERDIHKYKYNVQGAIYKKAVEAGYGYTPEKWYIVAVESKPPYDVVVYRLCDSLLEFGERQACGWLSQLRACQGADHWPGYSETVVELEAPEWALDDEETEDETDPEESTEEVAA